MKLAEDVAKGTALTPRSGFPAPRSRILIVDDERSIRVTLSEFLKAGGHDVTMVANADEAVRLLKAREFDVVVSDIVLPRISGVELLKKIDAVAPSTRVIMMTGEPTVETAVEAVRVGAQDYLSKPVSKAAILRAVNHAAQLKALDDERRRLAAANREYQERLERMVAERTRDLQQALEDLRRAQTQMIQQERLKALGQMVSGIAHDFNNVLMPIMGLPDHLLSTPDLLDDREAVVRAFSDILCAASDAREIVRRLREFYRPEEQLAVQPIQVKDLIGRVIDLTKPAWKTQAEAVGKEIRMVTEIDSAISLTGNEAALREMLTNLTLNAIDAIIRQGTIKFKIAQNEHWIEIQVSDTGAGMTEEVRQRCFEPFYTTKGEQGTGLGLAMCYGIVQRHNGHIEVASELGQGTTFTIRLPREAAQGEAREAKEEKVLSRKRRALRVLVVDDEEVSRALLVKYLSGAGHTVTAVASGPEAVRLIQNQAFDLVLTDRAMPGMSGDEVAKTVKRLAPGLPIIMLTGLGEMMKFKSEHPVGVDAVVGKPITPTELEAAIRQVLVKRKKTPS